MYCREFLSFLSKYLVSEDRSRTGKSTSMDRSYTWTTSYPDNKGYNRKKGHSLICRLGKGLLNTTERYAPLIKRRYKSPNRCTPQTRSLYIRLHCHTVKFVCETSYCKRSVMRQKERRCFCRQGFGPCLSI